MLLNNYTKKLSWSECKAYYGMLQCVAELEQDIGEVLPFLNSVMAGRNYTVDPVSLTLRIDGRDVVIHARRIYISNVEDEATAAGILEGLKAKINEVWERRGEIEPSSEVRDKPSVVEMLRILTGSKCAGAGLSSCVAYAVEVSEGLREPEDCPSLSMEEKSRVRAYVEEVHSGP